MAQQLIPLDTAQNQSWSVALSIDGGITVLSMLLHYNTAAGYWTATITDSNGNLVLDSVPLVTGASPANNFLGQFAYLGIGSATIYNAGNSPDDHPDNTNLGTDFQLVWNDTPVVL